MATHTEFIGIPFIQPYEEVAYEGRITSRMTQFGNNEVVSEGASLDSWCGGSDLRE